MEKIIDSEITLKQISRDFAHDLFILVQKNKNGNLCYWCPDLKKTYASLETTFTHINDANSKFEADKTPDFVIFYKGIIAGLISLSPINSGNLTSEIGYWLGSEYEGLGIISRSFPFVLDYAKDVLQLKAIELSTSIPNIRSQKLPINFKFQKVRTIPNAEILEDGKVDHILWRREF
ncbi:MAG: GNAT family N-acetyltransferase [Bdellovibrio sp.]|nr:GNAT family N-acetyltransferase [Bdellovibrio sp.]